MKKAEKPDLKQLFISWSGEFSAQVDRVYNLIGGAHHAELGNHREILFRNFLRKYLPKSWNISTGFVIGENGEISRQQDVIIWDAQNFIPYLQEHDFVIVPQQAVYALIEIKTNLSKKELKNALNCLHSPMFNNWRLAKKNPWPEMNNKQRVVNVPFRGIFALKKQRSMVGIFDDIIEFYDWYYPSQSRRDIIVEHVQSLRYIHLIDAICVLDNLAIDQYIVNLESYGSQPCFRAWQFKNRSQSMALAWFLHYMYQEINNKIITQQARESLGISRGEEAKPFMCVFDSKLIDEAKKKKNTKTSFLDIHQSKIGLW